MKISRIQIENYRSIRSLDLAVDNYTALVGANGSGKSSVLYALNWFFDGGALDASDVNGDLDAGTATGPVAVTVTFVGLTTQDRVRLEKYGRGSTATFKRSWALGDERDKIVGHALQGPGFGDIRAMKLVGDFRPAYSTLRGTINDLPDLGRSPSKDEIEAAFAAWEDNDAHKPNLELVDSADANHLFGIGGSSVIKQCVRMVLVPASSDISGEVGGNKKGTALNELIGSLMTAASTAAKDAWIVKNKNIIDELSTAMLESVTQSTGLQSSRVNDRLAALVPNARVNFKPDVPEWVPSPSAIIQTDVVIDGVNNDVSRQGHGVQRAVMIAMLQSLVPDALLAESTLDVIEGEDEAAKLARLESVLLSLPNILVCIEEPEIYQHPVRARAFARVLADLATQPNAQVLLATHSPYFTRPDQFSSIRRFALVAGESVAAATTVGAIARKSGSPADQVEKIIEKRLPTTFSEGFFADAVVLVEGDTDKVVIEAVAEKQGRSLDAAGVSVLGMSGKGGLGIPLAMLGELGIPVYLIADADALGAKRKHPSDAKTEANAHAKHKSDTEKLLAKLPSSTAQIGSLPFSFGDATVVCQHYTIWHDDIEHELASWPSFITALSANGGALRDKNVLAYRAAVLDADLADMPACIDKVIEAAINFRQLPQARAAIAANVSQ